MSDSPARCDNDYCAECGVYVYTDGRYEQTEIGLLCYGCSLSSWRRQAEARVKELEEFVRQVVANNEDSQYFEDAADSLAALARQAAKILGADK